MRRAGGLLQSPYPSSTRSVNPAIARGRRLNLHREICQEYFRCHVEETLHHTALEIPDWMLQETCSTTGLVETPVVNCSEKFYAISKRCWTAPLAMTLTRVLPIHHLLAWHGRRYKNSLLMQFPNNLGVYRRNEVCLSLAWIDQTKRSICANVATK